MNKLPRVDSNHDKVIQSRSVRLQKLPTVLRCAQKRLRCGEHFTRPSGFHERVDPEMSALCCCQIIRGFSQLHLEVNSGGEPNCQSR
jgi:hypothetical protein